jgi:RNA polymerase sigma factor (sigma-70 family)
MTRENEEKKEYLKKLRESKNALKRIEEQLKEVESETVPKMSKINTVVRGSSMRKDLSDYISKKEELVNKMTKAKYERVDIYNDVFHAIEEMNDERERTILTLRYIKGLKWEEIAVQLHVERAQVHRIHAKALKHFNIPKTEVQAKIDIATRK